LIPAAPLAWFDAADQGLVLLIGDDGRHSTEAWLHERRVKRGGRLVRVNDLDVPATVLRHARRWDIDTVFCSDCTHPSVFPAALEAAEEGALVVLSLHARDIVDGMTYLRSLLVAGMSGRGLEVLSRQLCLAMSERAVTREDGSGTVAAFEVLDVTPAQRNFIREDSIHALPAQMAARGHTAARWWPDALADLILEGTCTLEAAVAAGHVSGEVERALERAEKSSTPSRPGPTRKG